jgi:hypothetical protein
MNHLNGGIVAIVILASHLMPAVAGDPVQCVPYVKQQKTEYNITYPGGKSWIYARDIFDLVYDPSKPDSNRNRGYVPVVDSVFVIDTCDACPVGHVGIVTAVAKDSSGKVISFSVRHCNWTPGKIETGVFRLLSNNSVAYNNGVKPYPLRGFTYRPK